MCGITGIYSPSASVDSSALSAMTDTLSHRGPDDSGTYVSEDKTVGLGHTRLSIIDLSEKGHQPMASDDLKIQVSYNGEIYNYREIRGELRSKGHVFRTNSDTEVLVRSYEQWGIECLHKFIGMFALAIWDGRENKLYLARDRVGIKPLYYYRGNGLFLFGSELKAIMKHQGFSKRIDPDGLALFLRYNYIRSPYTIFKNTFKLQPGHYICLQNGKLEKRKYWDIAESYNGEPYFFSEEEACERLEEKIIDSLKYRLVSDVPVGLFLSGGIDSSLIATLLQKNISTPLKTFTIGFDEEKYNEAKWAAKLADYLGTEHVESYVSEDEAIKTVSQIPSIYDEPFADTSSIPTCVVSRLASEHVKVVMSGDGGDELFCGYKHYMRCMRLAYIIQKTPGVIQSGLKAVLSDLSVRRFESIRRTLGLSSLKKRGKSYEKNRAALLNFIEKDMPEMYRCRMGTWAPEDLQGLLKENQGIHDETFNEDFAAIENGDLLTQMLYADFNVWLPDDILTKVDRASMSMGLEAREPLLDHRLVRFAARIPLNLKFKDGESKYILKKVLSRHIPDELYQRPKRGFSSPIGIWLRGKLKPLVEEYLSTDAIRKSGVFDPDEVFQWKDRFYNGSFIGPSRIWNLLMFQMWYERWH